MNYLFKQCAIGCLIFLSSCDRKPYSKIDSIDSLSKAEKAFNVADDKTLIVFDVDETLLMPVDALWQQGRIWEIDVAKNVSLPEQVKNVFKNMNPNDLAIFSQRMLNAQFKTVEDNTLSIIKALQARHLKVIALTNFGPGQFGTIPSLKEWRRSQLCGIGIDFESSFPGLALIFSHLPTRQGSHPEFYKGILFGANNPKGVVLGAFLDQLDYKPAKIIVIDDKEKYLLSVKEELVKRHIHFQGFLYAGAEKQANAIDPTVIGYQLERWAKYNEYVSDSEACAYLEKHTACA